MLYLIAINSAVEAQMSDFLNMCKERLAEAQRRFMHSQATLQRAQQEFAQAQLEFNNWQGVVAAETRRLALQQQAAQANQTVLAIAVPAPQSTAPQILAVPHHQTKPVVSTTSEGNTEVNKTELVRELLAQHPEGMTPIEVWNVLKNQIARPYVYSILKRLKDADQVIYQRRRKKYSLRVPQKPEEVNKEQAIVH
jgi:hypothetical protein